MHIATARIAPGMSGEFPLPGVSATRVTITKFRTIPDEEIEMIDLRYEKALALSALEELFGEGHLDSI
jgi:hypothetical protein